MKANIKKMNAASTASDEYVPLLKALLETVYHEISYSKNTMRDTALRTMLKLCTRS